MLLLSALKRELPRLAGIVGIAGGVGQGAAAAAAIDGDQRFNPSRVVSVGYCGGLDPALKVGDVVTAAAVLAPDGTRFPAEPLGSPAVTVATADAVVAAPAAKAALFAATGAAVVDMEAAGVAAACGARGMPFSAVKVVTDAAGDALPADLAPFLALDRGVGLRSVAACLAAVAARPAVVRDLWRLGASAEVCSRALRDHLRAAPRPHRTGG